MSNPFPSLAETAGSVRATGAGLGAVGRYELLLELAAGGMAMVYLACSRDRTAGPLVAIKRPHRHLASDKNFLTMLLDEARLASAIDHPNVVKVRELGFDAGEPFIVMDYIEGASLAEIRTELAVAHRAIDVKVALRIVIDALAGLHAAHELLDKNGRPLGIIHRDISPHNVLVGSDGNSRVADFGIAHAADRLQVTRTHEVKGKLAYLAPERIDHRRLCTKQSDVFSMAIVLWECVVGRRLFRGDQAVDTLQEVMHAPIPRLGDVGASVPRILDDVVARALSRDLDVRFATAAEFSNALQRAAGPNLIGRSEAVAQLVEALHGERLAARHGQVRAVVQDDAIATRLLGDTGLRLRSGDARGPLSTGVLSQVAPPAPSERYAFGAGRVRPGRAGQGRRMTAGVAGGVALCAVAVAALSAHRPNVRAQTNPGVEGVPRRAPLVGAALTSSLHHAAVPLPFLASYVSVDGVGYPIVPASDLADVEMVDGSGMTHHVVVTALDGTVAQADVATDGEYARPIGPGFMLLRAHSASSEPPPVASPATMHGGVGAVRNGFTKLK